MRENLADMDRLVEMISALVDDTSETAENSIASESNCVFHTSAAEDAAV